MGPHGTVPAVIRGASGGEPGSRAVLLHSGIDLEQQYRESLYQVILFSRILSDLSFPSSSIPSNAYLFHRAPGPVSLSFNQYPTLRDLCLECFGFVSRVLRSLWLRKERSILLRKSERSVEPKSSSETRQFGLGVRLAGNGVLAAAWTG